MEFYGKVWFSNFWVMICSTPRKKHNNKFEHRISSQGIDRFSDQKRLHAEINVGAGLSEDFAKISKNKIKTRPPQPESSANRSDLKMAKNSLNQ
jgi:hypothetical protein